MLRYLTIVCGLSVLILYQACESSKRPKKDLVELHPYTWELLDSGTFQVDDLKMNKASVLITMDPECPMCANYSKVINELAPKYLSDSIQFYGLFTGPFSTKREIKAFALKYKVEIPFILDPEYRLASYFNAEVTPEVFVIDSSGKLVYQGLIDNWAIALGKKRKRASEHYLADALEAINSGNDLEVEFTKAVGCIIEYDIE